MKINRIALICLIIIIVTLYLLKKINDISSPILLEFATKDSYNIVNRIVNNSVNNVIENNFDVDRLFILSNDETNKLVSVDFDSVMLNKVITIISLEIEKQLCNIEEKKY